MCLGLDTAVQVTLLDPAKGSAGRSWTVPILHKAHPPFKSFARSSISSQPLSTSSRSASKISCTPYLTWPSGGVGQSPGEIAADVVLSLVAQLPVSPCPGLAGWTCTLGAPDLPMPIHGKKPPSLQRTQRNVRRISDQAALPSRCKRS